MPVILREADGLFFIFPRRKGSRGVEAVEPVGELSLTKTRAGAKIPLGKRTFSPRSNTIKLRVCVRVRNEENEPPAARGS